MLSLRLYEPVLYSTIFLEDISLDAIATWRRSTRRTGGYWRGSFTLYGDPARLAKFYYERLACHLVERWGGMPTWEGMIYEMDLTIGGTTRRRSLDMMANYITTTYIDNDGAVQTSSAASNANSIKWFGRREELLTLDGYAQTAAEKYRDTYLKEHAWPYSHPVGALGTMDENQLTVTVCGYIFTANWRYASAGDGTEDDVDDYISEILLADCEWLKGGRFISNTLQVTKEQSIPTRAYDAITELTDLGDADGNPWRFWVDNDQRANYRLIDVTPEYYLRGGKMYAAAGGSQEIVPWVVKPGVIRDMSYPVSKWNYSGWLDDARDFYIDEVEAGPGGLVLKTELFEEGEILAAQAAYNNILQTVAPMDTGAGGGGSGMHVWQHLGYTRAQRLAMSPEEWQAIKRAAQKRKRETGRF